MISEKFQNNFAETTKNTGGFISVQTDNIYVSVATKLFFLFQLWNKKGKQ